ncbi:MAG: hypothetical protein JWL99_6687 [Streptomyces oryziradicis]|nr:hypothetical protein [Actinacidiphila oryziradicis]
MAGIRQEGCRKIRWDRIKSRAQWLSPLYTIYRIVHEIWSHL